MVIPKELSDVVDAARCIRHWHDAMRDNSGMIVSAECVRKLWKALDEYDEFLKKDNQ